MAEQKQLGKLACGCEFRGGMAVTPAMVKAHYKHTFEALLFWELMHRSSEDPVNEARVKLSQARIDLLEAIDKLYPEATTE